MSKATAYRSLLTNQHLAFVQPLPDIALAEVGSYFKLRVPRAQTAVVLNLLLSQYKVD